MKERYENTFSYLLLLLLLLLLVSAVPQF